MSSAFVTEPVAYVNTFHCTQIQVLSEVVCQVLSSLSQWSYGNTFHCTHRHKSAVNTTTKHPHTPNSSQTVTAINGTEPSWELQILLQPNPVNKRYNTASIIHSHIRKLKMANAWISETENDIEEHQITQSVLHLGKSYVILKVSKKNRDGKQELLGSLD